MVVEWWCGHRVQPSDGPCLGRSAAMNQDAAAADPAPQAGEVKILIDLPSKKPSLGFDATASALAQIIRDSPPRFAVGIFGNWGSGKTTLMEEIRRKLGN